MYDEFGFEGEADQPPMGGEGPPMTAPEPSPYFDARSRFAGISPPPSQGGPQIIEGGSPYTLPNGMTVRDVPTPGGGYGGPGAAAGADIGRNFNALARQMQSGPLTHAEEMRLLQLRNGLSQVQQRVFSGEYSPQEGRDLEMLLQTGIDPLQRRQQTTRMAAMQQHMEIEGAQAAVQLARQAHAMKFMADNGSDGTFYLRDKDTGQQVREHGLFQFDHHGQMVPVAGTSRAERDPVTPAILLTTHSNVVKEVNKEFGNGKPLDPNNKAGGTNPAGILARWWPGTNPPTEADMANIKEMEIQQRMADQVELLRGGRRGGGQPGGQPATQSGGAPGQPEGAPAAPNPLAAMQQLADSSPHLDRAGRAAAQSGLAEIGAILRIYPGGMSDPRMPESTKRHYVELGRKVAERLRPPAPTSPREPEQSPLMGSGTPTGGMPTAPLW